MIQNLFTDLGFRHFQVDLDPPIEIDEPVGIPELALWRERLGQMILNDPVDESVQREVGQIA